MGHEWRTVKGTLPPVSPCVSFSWGTEGAQGNTIAHVSSLQCTNKDWRRRRINGKKENSSPIYPSDGEREGIMGYLRYNNEYIWREGNKGDKAYSEVPISIRIPYPYRYIEVTTYRSVFRTLLSISIRIYSVFRTMFSKLSRTQTVSVL